MALACSADAGDGVFNVEFIKDGKQFVTTAKSIDIWETVSCRKISEFKGEPDADYFSFLDPSGKVLLTLQLINERSLKLVDIESGKELVTFSGHETKLAAVEFSPKGKRLVTSDETGLIKIWDVETGQELISLKVKAGEAGQIKFSPDGSVLATAGNDGTIRLFRSIEKIN